MALDTRCSGVRRVAAQHVGIALGLAFGRENLKPRKSRQQIKGEGKNGPL